jgi:hypothetical protein
MQNQYYGQVPRQHYVPPYAAQTQPATGYPMAYPAPGLVATHAAPRVRMMAWLYLTGILGTAFLSALLFTWGATDDHVTELLAVAWMPSVVGVVMSWVMIYKMWAAIQDGAAFTTPGKALGFLFIPFFNYYWVFQALPGWATDYNLYIQRHGIQVRPMSRGLILCAMFLSWVPVVGLVLSGMMIHRICSSVNALSPR